VNNTGVNVLLRNKAIPCLLTPSTASCLPETKEEFHLARALLFGGRSGENLKNYSSISLCYPSVGVGYCM
jgi:hypothetical protein